MGGILSLNPEGIEKRIHPRALDHYKRFQADVRFAVPLEEITEADLNEHLRDNEKPDFQRYINQITDGLRTCMDIGDGDSLDNQTKLLLFEVQAMTPMFSIKQLLERVYDRKVKSVRGKQKKKDEEERQKAAKAEEGRKKKEEEERWRAACKAVNPPTDDARRYLDRPGEYDEFIQAVLKAIEVFMEKGQDYLNDSRTFDYRWCLEKINDRKEKERRHIAAKLEAREYNQLLNKEKTRLKALLCPNKKDLKSYFEKEIKDRRYTGENFTQFLSSEEEKAFDNTIVDIATRRLDKLVSNDHRRFIDGEYYRCFSLLPSADYSFMGVPCVDFIFDVFVVVETRVWLKPGQKTFGGYVFNLPWREEKGYSVLLQEPEFLGFDYVVLTPEDIGGYVPWESIPLILIQGLMNGELQPAGTTILAASENGRTYRIENFKEEVTIPRSFENYLKKIGNVEQMVSIGIVDQEVANVIKENLSQSLTEQRTGAFQNGQAAGFTDEELISSLTSLGIARKASEELCSRVPKDLSLDEAIKFALQNHSEIIVD